jgi:hypothetical protein
MGIKPSPENLPSPSHNATWGEFDGAKRISREEPNAISAAVRVLVWADAATCRSVSIRQPLRPCLRVAAPPGRTGYGRAGD